jgi:hypothetical protein
VEIRCQWATRATGGSAAVRLAHGDGESVKIVEDPGQIRPLTDGLMQGRPRIRFGGEGLVGERESLTGKFDKRLVPFAVAAGREFQQLVSLDDAAQILVGYRDRMAEGVQQNGVGGLGANSRQGQ